jgi:5-(carboxyamino)imidazole ribonucleotide mutase
MASMRDREFALSIGRFLEAFGIGFDYRVASAHKTPEKVLEILKSYEEGGEDILYITIAGRSNALSGMVDANTRFPVIAAPILREGAETLDIFSSLRMPIGVAPLVILEAENAALAAAKILALKDESLAERVRAYQSMKRDEVVEADSSMESRS